MQILACFDGYIIPMQITYIIQKSRRRSISVSIMADNKVLVKAPYGTNRIRPWQGKYFPALLKKPGFRSYSFSLWKQDSGHSTV